VRATPSSLSSAAEGLAADSGVDNADCRTALERLLLVASRTEKQRAGRGNEDLFFGVATPVHFRGGSCALDH
jgi:hypothetical protein